MFNFTNLLPTLVKKGMEIFDKKFVTEGEKELAQKEYEKYLANELNRAWEAEQKELTKRHENDMHSDSWLSKNIRPMVLIYLMLLFTLAFFMQVPAPIIKMLNDLLMTSFVFYFGSRSLEKIANKMTDFKQIRR